MAFRLDKREPLLCEDGSLWQFMPKVGGKFFRCTERLTVSGSDICGCNVFHKPDRTQLNRYRCNSCGAEYIGEG